MKKKIFLYLMFKIIDIVKYDKIKMTKQRQIKGTWRKGRQKYKGYRIRRGNNVKEHIMQ